MLNFRRYLYLSTIQIQMFKREPLQFGENKATLLLVQNTPKLSKEI